ncbi:hypothetical protein GCM10009736_21040 [Actinomadura bangladeshensis]
MRQSSSGSPCENRRKCPDKAKHWWERLSARSEKCIQGTDGASAPPAAPRRREPAAAGPGPRSRAEPAEPDEMSHSVTIVTKVSAGHIACYMPFTNGQQV